MSVSFIPTSLRDALAGKYEIERELGRGGMATVYLAHDQRHERPVAIKVLDASESVALGIERFEREIKVLARLRHPFILPLHDSGDAAGSLFFVMSYIDGESLRARLDRNGPLQLAQALGIAQQIADALGYAHSENVVHRDVKPENILLSRHGHALLADFGIARGALLHSGADINLTVEGVAIGTAAYMSPEQALGESGIDGRSDVYSLGCIVHEMLAGQPPFAGKTALSIVAQHVSTPAPSLKTLVVGLSPSIVAAVSRALAKEPGEGWRSAIGWRACFSPASGLGAGFRGTGRREARASLDTAALHGLPPIYQAMGSASLGDYSAAFNALDRAFEAHSDWMYAVPSQPWFRPMHSDPRFMRLLKRMGLEPEQLARS